MQISPWIALLALLTLSCVRPLSTLDQVFRSHALRIGGIPTETVRLRDAITVAKFEIREDSSTEIHFTALRRGLDLGNVRSLPDHTLHSHFIRASQLKHFLDRCQQERRFARFFNENARPHLHLCRHAHRAR